MNAFTEDAVDDVSATFYYGPDRERYKQIAVTASGGSLPAGTESTIYIGGIFEKVTGVSGVVSYRHYIVGADGAAAIRTIGNDGTDQTRYLHKDQLGSVDTVTDSSGNIVAKLSYDAFGNRRSGATWSGSPSATDWTAVATTTPRGYTYQEHLDNVDLIHMNGRVYDPGIGRFISADPTIPAVLNSQSLNRYSYVFNNPLTFTDPDGYGFFSDLGDTLFGLVKTVAPFVAAAWVGPEVYGALGSGIWSSAASAAAAGFTYGAVNVAVNGGNLREVVNGGFYGAAASFGAALAIAGAEAGIQFVADQEELATEASLRGGVIVASTSPAELPTVYIRAWAYNNSSWWQRVLWDTAQTVRNHPFAMATAGIGLAVITGGAAVPEEAAALATVEGGTELAVAATGEAEAAAAGTEAASGAVEAGETAEEGAIDGGSATNAMNGMRLSQQLTLESANSAFTETGELSEGAISGSQEIIPAGQLGNPAIPDGFAKFSTDTFASPSGPFQVHFYMNSTTGEVFYDLDYKAVFVGP